MAEKVIFICCFHPLVSRNILATPFFDLLRKDQRIRIILIVPQKKQSFFERYYGGVRVVIVGVPRKLNELDYLFKDIAAAAIRTKARSLIRKMRLGHERWNAYRIFFWAPLVRKLIPSLYSILIPKNRYSELFEHFKPTLVFTTDVFNPMDVILMHEAKHRGVRVLGMVRSWDNLTAKGGFRVVPDILVVNNEVVKREAIDIHHIPSAGIKVVGVPHYDLFRQGEPISKEDFFKKIGKVQDSRFIVYAPLGNRFFTKNTFDQEMIRILLKILPLDYNLLVRCPPGDDVDLIGVPDDPRLIVDRPGTHLRDSGFSRMDTEMSPDDDRWLAATLYWSKLLVSGFTTLSIDALRFDKPVILIAFDAITPLPYSESVLRHYEFEHVQSVLKGKSARLVKNVAELKKTMDMYLNDPVIDQDERRAVLIEQCFAFDGNSGRRLFELIEANL